MLKTFVLLNICEEIMIAIFQKFKRTVLFDIFCNFNSLLSHKTFG